MSSRLQHCQTPLGPTLAGAQEVTQNQTASLLLLVEPSALYFTLAAFSVDI